MDDAYDNTDRCNVFGRKERRMTTMKSAEEFKQEALQAIKDMGGFPYNPDIYWSYRAVKDIPVWKEQYFHPARGDGKSSQNLERLLEKIDRMLEEQKNE